MSLVVANNRNIYTFPKKIYSGFIHAFLLAGTPQILRKADGSAVRFFNHFSHY